VGDSKETIRQRVRGIFKALCSIYPFSKVFSTILEHGLDNKNARVRSECIEELGQLYARHGVNVHPISQALPRIASFIGKPDATTRTAALHAIGAVYTLVGPDATWKAVGQLPPKDRSMLEERLKRTATGVASPAPAARVAPSADRPGTPGGGGLRPPASRLAPPASPSPANGSATSQPRVGGIPRPGAIPSRLQRPQSAAAPIEQEQEMAPPPVRKSMPAPGFASKPVSRPASLRPPSGSTAQFTEDDLMAETVSDLPSLIDALETDDFTACADVLKHISREITKNSEHVLLHVDALIDAVTARMELGFTNLGADTPPAQLRLCKHLMQTLSAFFDKRTLSQQVSRLPLTGLLADLAGRLLDTADNPVSEPIQSLSKVLNMVLIRVFHNADQNVCFGCARPRSDPLLDRACPDRVLRSQCPLDGLAGRDHRPARAARRRARGPRQVCRARHEGAPLLLTSRALGSQLIETSRCRAVPVEGVKDGQGEPGEPQPPRAAPLERHQPVPRDDPAGRVASPLDRQRPAGRHAPAHGQDNSAAGRLGPQDPRLRRARRGRPGRTLVRVPVPLPARQPAGWWRVRTLSSLVVFARATGLGRVPLVAAATRRRPVARLKRVATAQQDELATDDFPRRPAAGDIARWHRHCRQPAAQGDL